MKQRRQRSAVHCLRLSLAQLGRPRHSPEDRLKIGERSRAMWADPSMREHLLGAFKGRRRPSSSAAAKAAIERERIIERESFTATEQRRGLDPDDAADLAVWIGEHVIRDDE